MPSRKNELNDSQTASRRSSLRRLSSIASLQMLFGRRRSNNNTSDPVNSSSSNLSLSSSIVANAPDPVTENKHPSKQDEDTLAELPPPPIPAYMPSRRSSYICLPDDPIGGMPRSRTFSNLPLPTRAKRTAPLVSSKFHSRLPSAFLPSTRLPSPSMSYRKHSHTRLASASTNVPMVRNRMKRSDTEPLLGIKSEHSNNQPRSTAFKENISLSPIKPIPAMDMSDCSNYSNLSPPSEPYDFLPTWKETDESGEPYLGANFSSSPPTFNYPQHPAVRIAKEYKSSPIYRRAKDRPPTPGGSKAMDMQRWCSQPVLTNTTNVVHNTHNHHEIKQTRLMSARQAPTPPLSTKNLTISPRVDTGSKAENKHNSRHIRRSSEQSPTRSSPKKKAPSPIKGSLLEVHDREPPSYWCGRLCALADRYRNEELAALTSSTRSSSSRSPSLSPSNLYHHDYPHSRPSRFYVSKAANIPKSQTDKMHTLEATTARLRRALDTLHDLCVTPEAKDSLRVFQLQFASMTGCEELRRRNSIVLDAPAVSGASAEVGKSGHGGGEDEGLSVFVGTEGSVGFGISEGRKVTFMGRLLGRQGKRRSIGM